MTGCETSSEAGRTPRATTDYVPQNVISQCIHRHLAALPQRRVQAGDQGWQRPVPGGSTTRKRWDGPHLKPNQQAGYADYYDFASWVSSAGTSAWYRREHRGARMPQEMDRSRPATAQTGAAKAVTVTAMEPSFADQLARPRAVVIDPAAASQSPSSRAGAQSRLRAWFSRRHKGVPPARPTMPRRMVIGPRIEPPADDPLADYLMEVASAVDIRELEFDWPALTTLKDSGAVLVIPLMRTGSPASQEAGSGNHVTEARATHTVSRLTGGLADKPTAHSGEGTGRNAGEGSDGRAKDEHGRPADRRSCCGDRHRG